MTLPVERVSDMLSAPMEAVIIALGTGIARAQRELDRFAIETQREINQDPQLAEFGLQATFYQMPRAELELTMAIALEEQEQPATRSQASGGAAASALQPFRLRQLHIQPVNAAYTNLFSYDVRASSTLKLTIVPVPPPLADEAAGSRLSQDDVLGLARPHLVPGPDGQSPPADARLSATFDSRARLWTVLEYRLEGDQVRRLALVVVDDDTGQVVKAERQS
jgi:hypothetical protein